MAVQPESSIEENKHLRRCINDLVSTLALPAIWAGGEPSQIVSTLLDALLDMARLDLIYVRLRAPWGGELAEAVRVAPTWGSAPGSKEIGAMLSAFLTDGPQQWPPMIRISVRDIEISTVPFTLGLQGEIGVLAAGSQRADFPLQTERLILSVAANQAAMGLQAARLLREEKRGREELDRRVAERTAELIEAKRAERMAVETALSERARLAAFREQIAMALSRQDDLNGILHSCASAMVRHIDAAFARIWTLSADGRELELQASAGMYTRLDGSYSRIAVGQLKIGRIAQERKPHLTNDVQNDPRISEQDWARREKMIAFAGYPLVLEDRLVGVLGVFAQKPLTETTLEALSFAAGIIAQGIERKRAEERLRQSEADLLEAQRLTHTGSWKHDISSGKVSVSPEVHRILGSSAEEDAPGTEFWFRRIHPEDRQRVQEHFERCEIERCNYEADYRLLLPDGSVRHQHAIGRPVLSASGELMEFAGTAMDVTEQVEARIALQNAFDEIEKSEAKLRQVIDAIPTIAWCNLPDGPNEFLNKSWHEYTGLSPEESHGWGWGTAFHPDDLPPLMTKWQQMLVTGVPGDIEARIRRHDGVYRWFLIRAEPFLEDGKLVRWYGTSTDIDDRKRAEVALRDSEQSSRLILDGIAGLVAIMSPAGDVKAVNRQVLEYFGKNVEELKFWSTTDAVHPDDLPGVISAWTHSLQTSAPYDVDHRLRGADGVYRWFHARGLPLCDESGHVLRWYVLLTDIDDRRRAEEALHSSERELDLIVNTIPALAWSARPDGSAEFFNQHYLAYVGLPLEQLQGSGWTTAVHPDDLGALIAAWQSMRAAGKGGEVEARLRRFDGEYRWFLFRANPMLGESGGILKWYGTNTDIDRRKRAERELRDIQAELERVMRAMTLGQLTASIAHEVNQPLSGIVTNASTCLRMLDANPPNLEGARETARRTIRDGSRASEVVTRLRTLYSKKEPGLEPMDLNEATREVIALSLNELQRNRVILRQDLAQNLPMLLGDRIQIQQVILNLIRNGSDAMSAVDDRPREMLIKTESDGSVVRLSVKDTGVGFASQAEEKLFEAFYTTKGDGMGIGLSISRSIMESHRGRLWAARNQGPGATFTFSIPRGTNT